MTALERLPEERMELRSNGRSWYGRQQWAEVCESCYLHGACRDWVLSAAQEAQCDAEWLAQCVHDGLVDADTSIMEIQTLWQERKHASP